MCHCVWHVFHNIFELLQVLNLLYTPRHHQARVSTSVWPWSTRRNPVLDLWLGIYTARWWYCFSTNVNAWIFKTNTYYLNISNIEIVLYVNENYPFFFAVHIPEFLKEATVPLISTKKCNSSCMYNGEITPRMLCAGYTEGKVDACQVSSLLLKMFLKYIWH